MSEFSENGREQALEHEHAHDMDSGIEHDMADEEFLYDLSDLFGIFADTTRIKMLYALMEKDLSVSELAEEVGVSQSAASHQLRTLKQARLVKFRKDGKNVYYSLCDDHVITILQTGISHLCE